MRPACVCVCVRAALVEPRFLGKHIGGKARKQNIHAVSPTEGREDGERGLEVEEVEEEQQQT